MEWIKKNWAIVLWAITAIGGGITYYVQTEVKQAEYEPRMFRDAYERLKITDYVDKAPSPEQLQRQYFMDSLGKEAEKFRDSMQARLMESYMERDSLSRLNADQIYQFKVQVDDLAKEFRARRNNN